MNWTCAQCDAENKRTYKFCFTCGAARTDLEVAKSTEVRPPSVASEPAAPKAERTTEFEPVKSAAPMPDQDSGWRCHDCWFLNRDEETACLECGVRRRASERADRFDSVFGVFGKIGKWPIVLLGLVVLIAGLGLLYYYLNPKHGEPIEAPAGLAAEIRLSLDQVTSRQIAESKYFNCFSTSIDAVRESGGYAVSVTLAPKAATAADTAHDDRFWRFIAHREGYGWRVTRSPGVSAETPSDPCVIGQ